MLSWCQFCVGEVQSIPLIKSRLFRRELCLVPPAWRHWSCVGDCLEDVWLWSLENIWSVSLLSGRRTRLSLGQVADLFRAFKSACKANLIIKWENENPSCLVCYHHAQATEAFTKSFLYSLSWQVTSKWVALRKWGTWKMLYAEKQSWL